MAIEDVMILENSSVMYDEILAHRLGLIPITTDQSYNLPEECTCKSELGCEKCRASLSLEVEASDPVEVVYTSNLKPENPEVKPVSDKVPIVKLAQGQRIKLEAYARLGRGRDHAKWQPASACTYSYDPKAKTFNFFVESTGTLPPEKLVLDAARLISAKTLDSRKDSEEFLKVKKTVAVAQPEEIVDASNLILGRMASYVAKKALDGKSMVVINAERAVISGTKERVVARAKLKLKTRTLGNLEKSPTHPRKPDGYVRRVIRGMLPWKTRRQRRFP